MLQIAAETSALVGRCLLALDRHEEAIGELETTVHFCEENGARDLLWRLLASRSLAYKAIGDDSAAETDRRTALKVMNELAASVPSEALRAAFQGHPLAEPLRGQM